MVVYILPSNAKTLLGVGLFCNSNYIFLCSDVTLRSRSNVNIVEWLVSVTVVQLFLGAALTIFLWLSLYRLHL